MPKSDGSIQCDGDVLIELQSAADAALSKKQGGPPVGVARVETSGVTFERATGQAQTVKPVKFSFPSGNGKGIGAVYSSEEGQLRLVRDVEIELDATASNKPVKAIAPKEPVVITGSSLEFARNAHTLYLDGPVSAKTKTQELKSGQLTMWMDANFRAQTLIATPGTRNITPLISMHTERGISTLVAQKLTSQLAPQGWIRTLTAEGAVKGNSVDSKMSSETAEVEMWPQVNEAKLLTLRGNVQVDTHDAKTAALHTLRTNALQLNFDAGKPGQASRVKHGETLEHGTTESTDANGVRTRLDADKLAMDFGAKGKAQQVTATGTVRTEREVTGKPVQRASAATGVMVMAATGEWSKINLHGNVRMKEGDRSAESDDAVMIHDPQTAVLTGKAFVRDSTSETHAAKITFYQESGNFQAEGNVRSTDFSSKSSAVQLSQRASESFLRPHGWQFQKRSRFVYRPCPDVAGTVRAGGRFHRIAARHRTVNANGNVKGVFPQVPRGDDPSKANKPPTLWHVSSGKLSYFDLENRARLEENVVVQSIDQKMRAHPGPVFYQAADGKKKDGSQIDGPWGRDGGAGGRGGPARDCGDGRVHGRGPKICAKRWKSHNLRRYGRHDDKAAN